ncbi:hypothetical protein [Rhizobium favelukesii]|uniref:Uncharacterized protein n=1 Tax=Rhizobium favelukesii TaxID=348824 RepID=W6RUX9_9HYPH|nr:hypothetical protein [Rhizobium favelukesii]CDM62453.1 hypothetical protein LPU83_pLPU83d_1083 [Rhizobium favelukesii]
MRTSSNSLGFTTGGALGEDHRVSAGKVVGKLIVRFGHGKMESYSALPFQPFPLPSLDARFFAASPVNPFKQIAELCRSYDHRAVSR